MEAKTAVPNPLIAKELPITACVIISVNALMINRNKPNVSIVIGNVKITKIGFTRMFNSDKIKLASTAVPNPSK